VQDSQLRARPERHDRGFRAQVPRNTTGKLPRDKLPVRLDQLLTSSFVLIVPFCYNLPENRGNQAREGSEDAEATARQKAQHAAHRDRRNPDEIGRFVEPHLTTFSHLPRPRTGFATTSATTNSRRHEHMIRPTYPNVQQQAAATAPTPIDRIRPS
jgi:hypothetical protein